MPFLNPDKDNASASIESFSSLARTHSLALRNLVNNDELKHWLQELLASRFGSQAESANEASQAPRQAACERWLLSVARKWIARQGQTEQHNPSGNALIQSPAWVQKAVANGAPPQRLSLSPSERETLAGVLDWMRSDDGPALASDWSRISVEQAISSEKDWIDAMAKAALKKDLDAADAAGTTLFADSPAPGPDGRAGWRWVQVRSSDALDREGALMRHCVGSYSDDVASERKSIFSLRDPDNKPRLTLETQQGKIAQLKAFANQACPTELFTRVADFASAFDAFCQTKGWAIQTSDEAESAGLFAVPGLGFAIAGLPPPEKFSARFASDLEQPIPNANMLPLLAALGWTRLVQIALPHASIELKNQALLNASKQGNLELVELLLPHSDPKANGSQALIYAARRRNLPMVELLIPHSDPHANDSQAMLWASNNGHLDVLELLLPHCDLKADNSRALREAAKRGHLPMVELLLPHSNPHANSFALVMAAREGHLPIVEILLPYCDPQAKNAALINAAHIGQAAIVEALLPHSSPTAENFEALRLAVSKGHLAVVELLLPYSDSNGQSQALRKARENEFPEISQLIQASIDARIASPPPELAALRSKLAQERQRQSPPPPTGPAL